METKKSKVVKVDELESKGKAKASNVTFENGETHFTLSQFTVGQEYEYYIEERKSQAGKPYNVCCKPKDPDAQWGNRGPARYYWNSDYEGKAISMGMAYSKNLFKDKVAGVLGLTAIHKIIIPAMLTEIKASTKEREKEFVSFAMSYAIDMVLDEETRILMMDAFKIKDLTPDNMLGLITKLFDGTLKAMKSYD